MKRSAILLLLTSCLVIWPAYSTPRSPLGIYAVVIVDEYTGKYNDDLSHPAGPATLADPCAPVNDPKVTSVDTYFVCLYQNLLENNAVSGIQLTESWKQLNPHPPGTSNAYDWSLPDKLFAQVADWNRNHSTFPPKSVQLAPTPGFNSPGWLLNELYSCDFLFDYVVPPLGTVCGQVTFSGFIEGGRDKSGNPIPKDLPLPWDPTYKSAWQTFLTELNTRYGSKSTLVSISVSGPSASSGEMILPTTKSTKGAPQIGGFTPEEMWDKLLAYQYSNPAYLQSDQAFIDEWENAINMYGTIFSGITLIVNAGAGLPDLASTGFTVPPAFTSVCPIINMDCAAETTIFSYFMESTVGGPNAKSTQTDGMKGGGSTKNNLGVPNVKLISYDTDLYTSPSRRILGGVQFGKSFSMFPVSEGSNKLFSNPSPEQALYNVLSWFFEDTAYGAYFGTKGLAGRGDIGSDPLNYLQVYGPDIIYATANASNKQPVTMNGTVVNITAQNLLNAASEALGFIGERP
jgi:hypothetical protein